MSLPAVFFQSSLMAPKLGQRRNFFFNQFIFYGTVNAALKARKKTDWIRNVTKGGEKRQRTEIEI